MMDGLPRCLADAERDLAEAMDCLAEARDRLAEADETLRAIRAGEVDALIAADGPPGERVFTLASADRPYRMFVENMSDGAATVSAAGVVLYANRRLAHILDCPVDQIVGSMIQSWIPSPDHALLTEQGDTATVEMRLTSRAGRSISVLVGASTLDVEGDRLTCLTFTDLTAQKIQDDVIGRLSRTQVDQLGALQEVQSALMLKATHDSLTGLPNRALLVDRITQALAAALRSGDWTAVLFVDLDRFKQINDTHGHAAGDDILRQVAERLQAATRPMDTIARIGGDEFVVLTPNLTDEVEAVGVAGRLAESLKRVVGPRKGESVTASIGISVAGAGGASAEVMLSEADTAMYHAKSLGRNRAEVFDVALSLRAIERAATEEVLQGALRDGRLIAHYQPIVDLSTGQVAGFEALARIAQDDHEVLYPSAFIAVAEESGLIVALGDQMMSAACRQAQVWRHRGAGHFSPTVAVNLSPRQLERADLASRIETLLKETELDAQHLHLEITETALMELRPDVLLQLRQVRDLGVEIGLDDFGTGYASLTYLRRLPLTFVKVDRSFISGLGADIQDEQIAAAVIELTANLGLRSIAEGIESPQQLDWLRQLGCDQAQGYLFARPGPVVDPDRTYSVCGSDYPTPAPASHNPPTVLLPG